MENDISNEAFGNGEVHLSEPLFISDKQIPYKFNIFFYIEIHNLFVNVF